MRICARAIVIKDGQLLVMKRFKIDKTYYTLLGGTVEHGETAAEAAVREAREESGVVVSNPRLVFVEDAGDPYGPQHVHLCDYVSGEPELPADSEEMFWTKPGVNTYEPMWLPLDKLGETPFVSPLLKEAILMALASGWPAEPYHFSSKNAHRLS